MLRGPLGRVEVEPGRRWVMAVMKEQNTSNMALAMARWRAAGPAEARRR